MKFIRKSVVVEATQWLGWGRDPVLPEVQKLPDYIAARQYFNPARLGWIETLEGGHIVSERDWIITGDKGEKYPCKPDIFQEIYEPMT